MTLVVVKLGGEVVADASALGAIAADVAGLSASGTRVVVVHGGGPQATKLQEQLGQTPRKIAGRRVTDEATLDVMKMVVAGKLNVDVCAALVAAGARPVGLHGASGRAGQERRSKRSDDSGALHSAACRRRATRRDSIMKAAASRRARRPTRPAALCS